MEIRFIAAALLLTALINVAPLLLFDIGGDIDFHLVFIKCFAEQFWQGDFYPRWCFNANVGLGSPMPMFYFPLPYYAAALFYPLTYLGLSLHGIYVLSVLLATIVTVLACYLWLKDIVSPERALLASLLFIFMPYRMDVMLFRSAYAELWGMALVPLVFKYVRQLAQNHKNAMLPLAAVFGLLFITHLGAAAAAIIGSGLYMLITSGKAWMPKWRYAASVVWGAMLVAFYVVPAKYYQQFLVQSPDQPGHGWPDTYLQMNNIHYQTPLVLMIALTVFSLAIISLYIIPNRMRISDAFIGREVCAWGIIFIVALFLLFPISAPFYALIGPLKQVVYPWRMQNLFTLALAFFLSLWMQWFTSERRMKTWKVDFSILMLLLVLMSYAVVGVRTTGYDNTITNATIAAYPRYHTVWTDDDHFGYAYFLSRSAHKDAIHDVDIISGKGNIEIERWAWNGIILQAHSAHGITVRLNQVYFPAWLARADDGEPVTLRPEAKTGQMLLDISAGKHRILLHYVVSAGKPWLVWLANAASILAVLFWIGLMYRCHSRVKVS